MFRSHSGKLETSIVSTSPETNTPHSSFSIHTSLETNPSILLNEVFDSRIYIVFCSNLVVRFFLRSHHSNHQPNLHQDTETLYG